MASKQKKITIAGMVYVLLFAGAGSGIIDRDNDTKCGGEERWDVKVLVDIRADDINTKVRVTTIEDMNSIPDTPKITPKTERLDMEKQLYEIKDVFITEAILESDNDIHLVIEDGNKHHMIAEIPDPKCPDAKRSDFIKDFKDARKTMLDHKNDYSHYRFDITGVLFKDKKHPKPPTGNAENCIELHPVVKLTPKEKF